MARESERGARREFSREGSLGRGKRVRGRTFNQDFSRVTQDVSRVMDKVSTSFFFENFPEDWGRRNLWPVFQRYGAVVDMFVANKRTKSGCKFGFVRFKNVRSKESLEKDLNSIWIGSFKLRVNIARYQKQTSQWGIKGSSRRQAEDLAPCGAWRDGRKYAEVVGGSSKKSVEEQNLICEAGAICKTDVSVQKEWTGIVLKPRNEDLMWLNQCAVGEVKQFDSISQLQYLMKLEGFGNCKVKYVGGKRVLIECSSKESVDRTLEDGADWFEEWFEWVSPWSSQLSSPGRVVWLNVEGLPLHAWCKDAFTTIGGLWGKLISVESLTLQKEQVYLGKVCVLTNCMETIAQVLKIKVDSNLFDVRVFEDLSHLIDFGPRYSSSSQRNSEDDAAESANEASCEEDGVESDGEELSMEEKEKLTDVSRSGNFGTDYQAKTVDHGSDRMEAWSLAQAPKASSIVRDGGNQSGGSTLKANLSFDCEREGGLENPEELGLQGGEFRNADSEAQRSLGWAGLEKDRKERRPEANEVYRAQEEKGFRGSDAACRSCSRKTEGTQNKGQSRRRSRSKRVTEVLQNLEGGYEDADMSTPKALTSDPPTGTRRKKNQGCKLRKIQDGKVKAGAEQIEAVEVAGESIDDSAIERCNAKIREIGSRKDDESTEIMESLDREIEAVRKVGSPDRWRWHLHSSGTFSVKVLSSLVDEALLPSSPRGQAARWNSWAPRKVNVCIWRALQYRLPSKVNMAIRGFSVQDTLCPFCKQEEESLDHLFVCCSHARGVWHAVFSWWHIHAVPAGNLIQALTSQHLGCFNTAHQKVEFSDPDDTTRPTMNCTTEREGALIDNQMYGQKKRGLFVLESLDLPEHNRLEKGGSVVAATHDGTTRPHRFRVCSSSPTIPCTSGLAHLGHRSSKLRGGDVAVVVVMPEEQRSAASSRKDLRASLAFCQNPLETSIDVTVSKPSLAET